MNYKWVEKLKDDDEEYKWERKDLVKRNEYYYHFVVVVCNMWINMKKNWWVFVVSGGTPGERQQQQGNASWTFTAGRYLVPIFPLSNNCFVPNYWTIRYKLVLSDEGKKRGKRKVRGWKKRYICV